MHDNSGFSFQSKTKARNSMSIHHKLYREPDGTLPYFAWPGGYACVFLMADGETICADCANGKNGSDATTEPTDSQWQIVALYVRWEGPDQICAHCTKVMPSEYGDPDAE